MPKNRCWPTRRLNYEDDRPIVPPPDSMTVEDRPRPILYTHDGRPLYRPIDFRHTAKEP